MVKVAIAWYGAEGQSSYRYYAARGDDVTIATPAVAAQFPLPEGAQAIVGSGAFEHLHGFDIVVRSPSVRPDALKTDGKVWSATNEFFAQCPAPIIGVTGTKGKGTTCSLIASILRAAGKRVHLVGNIGLPALDVLPDIEPSDIVVYELSSFQLWDLERSPQVAVVLMMEQDHLDVHTDMNEYIAAKRNIATHQGADDVALYHPTNKLSADVALAGAGQKLRYGVADDGLVYVRDGMFMRGDDVICSVDALKIAGAFNWENACAALSAAMQVADISLQVASTGLSAFDGLPHRLKLVREVGGVCYYDNSIATTSGSAIAALQSFDGGRVLILGGSDKGSDYRPVVDACRQADARVVAIGQTGEHIAALCREMGVVVVRETGGMDAVVQAAAHLAKPGETVILSPASASFDQYKSYSDRGDQFVAAVGRL